MGITSVSHEENKGAYWNFNFLLKKSKDKIICMGFS